MTRMRAVEQDVFGGAEVLRLVERDRPEPGAGEVLVRVVAAGVNPADWKVRAGLVAPFEFPLTVGLDFSGVVADSRDARFSSGDRVFGMVFPPRGAYAEYVVARADAVAALPAELDHLEAAALPVAALTAWQALHRVAGLETGQRVLVHAAAGGVGHLAVQLAKLRGAEVVGTARAAKHDYLRGLGADQLIDYTETDFTTESGMVDVVLDAVGGEYSVRSMEVLKPGGILVDVTGRTGSAAHRAAALELATARGQRLAEFFVTPSSTDLADIAALVVSGKLKVTVGEVLPLREVARAHRIGETNRVRGKLVLRVDA
ncbi:NADP-dependent oxidoreductase [Amycolatopsis magusensis]|uniref:NADP-dependent oxidoreductase n=1 Tax=Amycolatopsis magusensis TaxID=882444 RepID=UPI0027B9C705|nr:NADP-dependent oxidoreductase [Amycolatopsis magusensis]